MTTNTPKPDAPESPAAPLEAVFPDASTQEAPLAEELSEDVKALIEAQARATEYQDAFMRAKAETENIRRRSVEDVAKAHKFAVESFAENLLPVIDSLEAAAASAAEAPDALKNGMDLTLKQLYSALEKSKVMPISPVGEKFDAHRHQAISMVPPPEGIAANHVVTVLQKGWLIADRVLRPALVTVAQG